MTNVAVIQPIEMGTNFSFDTVEKNGKLITLQISLKRETTS